jgi:hypothetical protein
MWKKSLLVLLVCIYFFLTPLWCYINNESVAFLSSIFILPLFACLPPTGYVLVWGLLFTGISHNAHDQTYNWVTQENVFGVSLYFFVLLTWCGVRQRTALMVSVLCSHPATAFDDISGFILVAFFLSALVYQCFLKQTLNTVNIKTFDWSVCSVEHITAFLFALIASGTGIVVTTDQLYWHASSISLLCVAAFLILDLYIEKFRVEILFLSALSVLILLLPSWPLSSFVLLGFGLLLSVVPPMTSPDVTHVQIKKASTGEIVAEFDVNQATLDKAERKLNEKNDSETSTLLDSSDNSTV